jgi:hypothetical protein
MPEPADENEAPKRRKISVGEEIDALEVVTIKVSEGRFNSFRQSIIIGVFSSVLPVLILYLLSGSGGSSGIVADTWQIYHLSPVFGIVMVVAISIFGYFWIKADG